jgi:uncharacterized protein (DUF362 family)
MNVKNEDEVRKAVHKAIELIGGFYPVNGSTIAIKPNLCSARKSPETGATTRVDVVEAIITYITNQQVDCDILIVESDSDRSANEAFKRLGYEELRDKYNNVRLINLSKDKVVKIVPTNPRKLLTVELPETLLYVDYFISIANLKRHVNERVTGVWKNQWGCLPYKLTRIRLHPFLSEALFDINLILWPDLCIIDGIIGLEGPGPIDGSPKWVGKILCSKDPLAIDIVATRIMGESPNRVPHLNYALRQLRRNINDIEVVGDDLMIINFEFITSLQYFLYRAGLRIRKVSTYIENIGYLLSILGYALRSVGFSELTKGEILSPATMLKIAGDLVFKVEASERTFG